MAGWEKFLIGVVVGMILMCILPAFAADPEKESNDE